MPWCCSTPSSCCSPPSPFFHNKLNTFTAYACRRGSCLALHSERAQACCPTLPVIRLRRSELLNARRARPRPAPHHCCPFFWPSTHRLRNHRRARNLRSLSHMQPATNPYQIMTYRVVFSVRFVPRGVRFLHQPRRVTPAITLLRQKPGQPRFRCGNNQGEHSGPSGLSTCIIHR